MVSRPKENAGDKPALPMTRHIASEAVQQKATSGDPKPSFLRPSTRADSCRPIKDDQTPVTFSIHHRARNHRDLLQRQDPSKWVICRRWKVDQGIVISHAPENVLLPLAALDVLGVDESPHRQDALNGHLNLAHLCPLQPMTQATRLLSTKFFMAHIPP